MNGSNTLLCRLRDLGDGVVLQDEPYPVVAPQTVEQTVACVTAARDESSVVMPLGSGSSFPGDFSLLRERLMAIMTIRLHGIENISPYAIRVMSGTPVAALAANLAGECRRTLGGFIADARTGTADPLLRAVWKRMRAIEVITGEGRLLTIAGPAQCGSYDGAAGWFIGSRGRLGMIVSIELVPPLSDHSSESNDERIHGSVIGPVDGDSVLGFGDIRSRLDPHGLFQW